MAAAKLDFTKLNASIDKLIKAVDKLDKKIENLAKNTPDFDKIFASKPITDFINALKGIDEVDVQKFKDVAIGIGAVAQAFSRLKTADATKIKAFNDFFRGIVETMRFVTTAVASIPDQGKLKEFAQVLSRIATAFKKFIEQVGSKKSGLVSGVASNFTKLIAVLKLVSFALGILPGGKALSEFSKVFDRLGRGLSSLSRVSRNINLKQIGKMAATLASVATGLRLATKIAGDPKKIQALGTAIQSISNFFSKVGNKGRKENLLDFPNTVRKIVQGLNEFNKIKVDARKIEAIGKSLEAIAKLQNIQSRLSTIGGGFGSGFFGVIKDQLLRDFVRAFEQAVTKFISNLSRLQRSIGSAITDIGNQIRAFGNQLETFGRNIINQFGLGRVLSSESFTVAADFDHLINQIQRFGDLTEEETRTAEAFVDQIGIQYPLSANEAAVALLNLQKAGLDLNSAMAALPSAAELAAISDSGSIDKTSQLLIAATNNFAEFRNGVAASFDTISVAADIVARAANNSRASVESLSDGLADVGPIASQFGLSFEETVAVLAQFEDRGIAGTRAGTQLRSMLTNLSRPTAQMQAVFESLGVSLADSEGNIKDITTIFRELDAAMNSTRTVTMDLTESLSEDQVAALNAAEQAYASATRQLFQYENGLNRASVAEDQTAEQVQQNAANVDELRRIQENAANVINEILPQGEQITQEIARTQFENFQLINQLGGSFGQMGVSILLAAGGTEEFITQMNELPGAAELAQQLMDDFKGDVEQLSGSLDTARKNVFLPLIQNELRAFAQGIKAIVDAFANLPRPVLAVISRMIFLGSAIATFVGGLAIAVGIILQFGGAILSVVGFLIAIQSNFLLVIGAITGFATALATMIVVATVILAVLGAISTAITFLVNIIRNDIGGSSQAFDRFKESVVGAFNSIKALTTAIAEVFSQIFGLGASTITLSTGNRISQMFLSLSDAIRRFDEDIRTVLAFVRTFERFFNLLSDSTPQAVADYNNAISQLITFPLVQRLFGEDIDARQIENVFLSIVTAINRIKLALANIGQGVFGLFSGDTTAISKIQAGLSSLFGLTLRFIQQITGINFFDAIFNLEAGNYQAGIQSFIDTVMLTIKNAILNAEPLITTVLTALFGHFNPAANAARILRLLGLNDFADVAQTISDQLVSVFGNIVGTVFDILRGQNIGDAIIGNFGESARPFIRLIRAVGKSIENIVGIFTDLFNILFPGGLDIGATAGGFIEVVFNAIARAFELFNERVLIPLRTNLPRIVNGIVQFINKIERLISPLIRFGKVLFEQVGVIINAIKDLASGNITFDQFITTLSNSIRTIGEALVRGIGEFIIQAGSLLGSSLLETIGAQIAQGDFSAAIITIATALGGLISRAILMVADFLIDTGENLGSPILVSIGESLQQGDFTGALSTIATAIFDLIVRAINSIPDLIIGIGDSLGLPIVSEIGRSIKEGEYIEIINIIAEGIADLITAALQAVPGLLTGVGNLLNLDFLMDIGITLEQSEAFRIFTVAIGNLAAYPLEVIGSGLQAITDAIKTFNENPIEVGPRVALLLAAGTFVVLRNALPIILSTLTRILTPLGLANVGVRGLGTAIRSTLIPLAKFAFAFVVIENVMENFNTLLDGDIGKFFKETLADIASDILGFFGIEVPSENIIRQAEQALSGIQLIILQIGNAIAIGIQNIFDGLLQEINKTRARIEILGGLNPTEFATDLFAIDEVFIAAAEEAGRIAPEGFRRLSEIISDSVGDSNFGDIQLQLRTQFSTIFNNFAQQDIPQIARENPELFEDLIRVSLNTGRFGDFAREVARQDENFLITFLEESVRIAPESVSQIDLNALLTELLTQFRAGQISPEVVIAVATTLQPLNASELTPEQLRNFTDLVSSEANELGRRLSGQGSTDAVQVETNVELVPRGVTIRQDAMLDDADILGPRPSVGIDVIPIVTDPERFSREATAQAQQATNTAPATIEIAPDVTVESAQDARDFTEALEGLETQGNATEAAIGAVSTALTLYAIQIVTKTLVASTAWGIHSSFVINRSIAIQNALRNTGTSIRNLTTTLILNGVVMMGTNILIGNSFATLQVRASNSMATIRNDASRTAIALGGLLAVASLVNASQGILAGIGNLFGGGRATGGSVKAGRIYEVNEGDIPELLKQGNRTFLLPGRDGMVMPPSQGRLAGAGGGMSVNVNMGGISISGDNVGQIQGMLDTLEQNVINRVANVVREVAASG